MNISPASRVITYKPRLNFPTRMTSMTMRTFIFLLLCGGTLARLALASGGETPARATVGQAAPNFTLTDESGQTRKLADFNGKIVILEWTNPECPFVKKFYDGGDMQKLQAEAVAKGAVWLRINSSAAGHEGAQTEKDLARYNSTQKVKATASLLDPTGKVGHLYGATNTPQLFVIDPKGTLTYAGGIDNKPSADAADIAGAKNYVTAALNDLLAGKPVTTPTARPYGCSVKYAR